jgi:Fe-S-cluster containining protein
MPKHSSPQVVFALHRGSAFSYRCNACSRCCHNKAIRVGPYEILRLARRLGISTTELISRYTEAGGTVLRTREGDDHACVFLGAQGCSVHPDRPLACRLYPLALRIEPDGKESFGEVPGHPETEGTYGKDGTVAGFFDQQGVAPYLEMAARYKRLYDRMTDRLERLDAEEFNKLAGRESEVMETGAGEVASP